MDVTKQKVSDSSMNDDRPMHCLDLKNLTKVSVRFSSVSVHPSAILLKRNERVEWKCLDDD